MFPQVLLVRGPLLPKIGGYCLRNGPPPLSVLAVNEDTDTPGEGYLGDPAVDTVRVREFNWQNVPEPTAEDFDG